MKTSTLLSYNHIKITDKISELFIVVLSCVMRIVMTAQSVGSVIRANTVSVTQLVSRNGDSQVPITLPIPLDLYSPQSRHNQIGYVFNTDCLLFLLTMSRTIK